MGERQKTLKSWLKWTRGRDVVEGTRLQTKNSPFENRHFLGQGHRRKCSPKNKKYINNVLKFFYTFKKKKGR